MAALLIFAFGSGFSWNFGSGNPCKDADKLAAELATMQDSQESAEAEQRIVTSCPEGAAAFYVRGLQLERQGSRERALAAYQEALKADPSFTLASGRMGLLYALQGQSDDAMVELTKGLAGGSDPRIHAALGRIFVDRKIPQLGLYHYGEALRLSPTDPGYLTGLGDSYAALNRFTDAEQSYRRALATQPANTEARIGLANLATRKNDLDSSIEELKKLVAANPGSRDNHRLLAEAYERAGRKDAADAEYILAGIPLMDRAADLLSKGDERVQAREYGKAIEFYSNALRHRPEWPEAQLKLASAYDAAGKNDEAIAAYRELLRLKVDGPDIHYSLGLLYERQGLLDEAIVEYRQLLGLKPDHHDARRRLADIYTLRGSLPQAIEQYRAILKNRSDNPVIHFKLARVLVSSRNIPEAITSYQEALRLDNDNVEAHRELAGLLRKREQTKEAEVHYRQVLRLKRDDQEAQNALTAIFVKEKRYAELATLLQENADLAPTDTMAQYKLGLVHEYMKKYEDAEAAYKKAIDLKADNAKALNALGRVYLKTGHLEEARSALEAAKKADPEMEEPGVLLSSIREELTPTPPSKWKKGKKGKKGKAAIKSKGKTKKSVVKKPAGKGAKTTVTKKKSTSTNNR
jgi:tetratricopeptide (TPR) repeat protein